MDPGKQAVILSRKQFLYKTAEREAYGWDVSGAVFSSGRSRAGGKDPAGLLDRIGQLRHDG
jgi:hypothetical protein